MKKGELLFFYATRPVSGIMGMANVEETTEGKTPLWPNEIREGKVKYPYRIRFKVAYMLKEADWKTKRLSLRNVNVTYYRGLNPIHDEGTMRKLNAEAKKIFKKSTQEYTNEVSKASCPWKERGFSDSK